MERRDYFEAIARGDTAALREMIEARPDLLAACASPGFDPEQQETCTGLHAAVYTEQPDVARLLIDAGIDVEARTAEGRTALHDSIEFGCGEITEMLLAHGAELDICSAAILGRLDRVRELLDADPELADDRSTGLSPLGWAAFGNQVEAARELIDHGARMDDGELLCAASVGHVELGRLLIERGADPNAFCGEGNALHAAAAMRYTDDSRGFIGMLLEMGADANLRAANGQTARELAEARGKAQAEASRRGEDVEPKQYAAVARLLREAEVDH